jgi:hypothetical protein
VSEAPASARRASSGIRMRRCELRRRSSARRTIQPKTEHEKTALQRQIDATDKQIDELVYELYGLTQQEIEIIEGKKG